MFGNVADGLGKIVQRLLREEQAVIHWGRSLRTFSISEQKLDGKGLVAPCPIPRTHGSGWMAQNVYRYSTLTMCLYQIS